MSAEFLFEGRQFRCFSQAIDDLTEFYVKELYRHQHFSIA